ncbi:hypothetical protein C8F01DRAFT_1322340 [Mycena amicta]|nr:hypothetical protein C8F01DRAFT_1322340 [Mycena amicta]
MYKKRADRAKPALEVARKALRDMEVWNSKDGKMYSGRTRRLLRRLDAAGVACSRIPQVLSVVFQELGIKVKCIPSLRTIRLAVKEGGFFAKMKVGRALANAKSYGLSSDGTTIKHVNYESRHIKVATTDPANPTAKPVFERLVLDLNHAHDHTAATQLEGDLAAGAAVHDAWNNSPLCTDEKITLERHDFLPKQKYQNMDHAKDGKSKLNLTRELKVLVTKDDLGKAKFAELSDLDWFNELCKITQGDLEEVYGPESVAQMSTSERNQARALILVQRLGDVAFDKLSEEQQRKIADIIFAGCMCHKDLNAFGYAVEELEAMWPKNDGPALLANKANDATIRLSQDPNSAALQKALESSTRGAMKLVELCAMVFRNSNDITGYQLLTTNFMERRKSECYPEEVRIGLINPRNLFPDFQRARFQTGSHGAAELFMFLDLYTELVETVIASKHNSGQANHIESNLLKGFRCLKTQTELAAETLYAVCVSWPYMRYARGGGSEAGGLINLLDTVDFHRKIVPFCKRFTAQPELLLDTATPDSELTIDGQPFMDQLVVTKIRSRAAELPEFHRALTATFNGAIKGWEIFTEEFKVGGEFDKLTDAEKAEMQIDSTNDVNEGGLGFLRQQFLKNPAGTIDFFRARAMYRRNNTESMAVYAMRETRKQDSSGSQKQFRLEHANRLIQKATTNNGKRERRLQEEADRRARLLATPVITQIPKLNMLNVKQLTAQMQIHWRIFKDPILCAIPNKSILKKKADLLAAVKGAVARYLIRTKNARRTRLQGDDTDAELEDSAESDTDTSDLDSADAWGGIDDGDTVGVGLPDAEDSDDDEGMSGEPPLRGFDEHMDVDKYSPNMGDATRSDDPGSNGAVERRVDLPSKCALNEPDPAAPRPHFATKMGQIES